MTEDEEIVKTFEKFKGKTKDELRQTRRGTVAARRIFNWSGIATIFVMIAWPGIFTIVVGAIIVYLAAQMSTTTDLIIGMIDKLLV